MEDPKPPPPATPSSRIAGAALPALLALFLGALTVGVLGSSVSGPPIFGILIRGFFGLVVGGIAAWMAAVAIRALRGDKQPAAGAQLPAAIAALCPACGRAAPEAQWCPFCEFPLGGRSDAWRAEEQSWGMALVGLALGAGLLCLGVFVTVGPMLEGERRIWAGIAFAALGLLITAVGALIIWGGALVARDDLRGLVRWSYLARLAVPGASYHVSGGVVVARGRLIHAEGHATMELALDALRAARRPPPLAPAQQAFARALSFLHQRGHLALWWMRATSWNIGVPLARGPFRRLPSAPAPGAPADGTMTMQLMMRFLASVPDDAAASLLQMLTPLAPGATPVAALWKTWRASGAELGRPPAPVPDGEAAERAVAVEIGEGVVN